MYFTSYTKRHRLSYQAAVLFLLYNIPGMFRWWKKHSAVNIISTAVINTQATKTKRSVYFPFFQVWTAADAVFSNTEKGTLSKSTGNRRKVLFSVPLF